MSDYSILGPVGKMVHRYITLSYIDQNATMVPYSKEKWDQK